MPWYEKDHHTPIEDTPITGLSFLHGDVVAQAYKQEWARGKKYPLITYPTGTSRELLDEPTNILLFGDVTIPYNVTSTEAFKVLASTPHVTQLRVGDFTQNEFVVVNRSSRRGYRLAFDGEHGELSDMTPVPEHTMELLPGELRAVLPKLYSTEQQGGNAIAPIKFFTPDANWTWYATEFDGNDMFFGLVSGNELEIGYFELSDLESIRGGLNLPIERDLHYTPQTLDALRDYHNKMNP